MLGQSIIIFVTVFGLIISPCVLMTVGFYSAIRRAYRSNSPARSLFLYPLICSFIMTSGFVIRECHAIFTSRSSMAGAGLFFLPFHSLAVAVSGLFVSWACLYVAHFVIQRIEGIPVGLTSVVFLALAIVLLVLTGYVAQSWIARHNLLTTAASGANADSLEKILASGVSSRDWEVLAKLAKNPNTPISDLVHLYDSCKHNITNPYPPEYPVLFSTGAESPHTP